MRILITGVAGHLGSCLAQWILDNVQGAEIFGLDDLSCGYAENVPKDVAWVTPTLGAKHHVIQGLRELDYVFHFAAYAAEGRSPFIRCYSYENNLLATAQVVNHCIEHGCKRLVFTSSMAVYGNSDGNPPFSETSPTIPIDPYGIAKLACEMDIRCAGEQHGLDWCVIRPHNVMGPHQCIWQNYRNVFGIWMRQHLEGKPLRICGDGNQTRAFTPIRDILPCLWQAAVSPKASKATINLGSGRHYSINDAATTLLDVIGQKTYPREHVEPRHEVKHAYVSTEVSECLLGYKDRTQLRQAVVGMWNWAQKAWINYPERRDRRDAVSSYEIQKGLYSFWRPNQEKNDGTLCLSGNPNRAEA